jgi:hypothetical protein
MNFSDALEALKDGERVRRSGWNGKGMWLALWHPGTYKLGSELLENCAALVDYASRTASKSIDVCGAIVMKTADGSVVFGWLASQTDMLAEDWEILHTVEP